MSNVPNATPLCLIMRGLPGSGKDYWLRQAKEKGEYLTGNGVLARKPFPRTIMIVSADDYFMSDGPDGEYRFDPRSLAAAHADCLERFMKLTAEGRDVAVSNTGINAWELAPYVAVASVHAYDVEIIQLDTPLNTCLERRGPGTMKPIPASTIGAMLEAMRREVLPSHWKVTRLRNG